MVEAVLRIPDPDIYPSRISDPGSNNSIEREGGKTNFLATNIIKLYQNYFSTGKKIFLAKTLRIIVLFTQKLLSKLGVLGSGKKTIPGSKRHRIPDPEHWGEEGWMGDVMVLI